jgi:hypothetical protein
MFLFREGNRGMNHTFLLREGFWVAEGEYFDEYGNVYSVVGQSETTHLEKVWVNEVILKVFFDEPVAIAHRYEIEPFGTGKTSTRWKSSNRILGNMMGHFVIEGGSILSLFRSEGGRYSGSEWLQMVDEGTYRSRRVLLDGDKMLSSWAMELRKTG